MISVDALLEFAVLEASAYEQRQLPCSHTRFAGQKNNLYNGKG